jgi:hypothetical protein
MAGFYTAQVAGNPSAIDIALSPTSSMAAVAQAATMLPQESASGYRESLNPSSAPGSKCAFATGGAVVLTVCDALESCPSGYVRKAAKVRAQGRAALGRYPLIGDRLGQCLVSDGFETRIGSADKTIPIQTVRFAIHTSGHERAFSVALDRVRNAPINRHTRPSVGNAAVSVPPNAPG